METFRKILSTAVEGGASDVHLKIGCADCLSHQPAPGGGGWPATPRKNGWNMVVNSILPRHHKAHIEELREVDFSYFMPGVGRFRTNCLPSAGPVLSGHAVCQNPGSLLRGTGPAAPIAANRRKPARHCPARRLDRLRQIHHAGRHGRTHQRQQPQTHHHPRRPHRIRL